MKSIINGNKAYSFRNCFVQIDEKEVIPFSIYPNPASNLISLTFSDVIEESKLSILNLNGQAVYTDVLASGNSYSLDTRFLTQGIYIVNIESATELYSTKLVKQ